MRSPRTAIASSRRIELNGVLAGTPVYTLACVKMRSALGLASVEAGVASCAKLCVAPRTEHSTAHPRLTLNLSIIPPPPPAPSSSAKSALGPTRVRWNRTTPAMYALHRPTHRRRWQLLPAPAKAEYSHRWMRAALALHSPVANQPRARLARSAPPPATLPRDGCRSRPLHNSRRTA